MLQINCVYFFLNTLVWVTILFLTWYGLVIVWMVSMYYRSFRSRVMFRKTLWNVFSFFEVIFKKIVKSFKVLNIIRFYFLIFINNRIISQKKFYPNPNPNQIFLIYNFFNFIKNCNPVLNNKKNINFNFTIGTGKNNKKFKHPQEQITMFNVEHNQQNYMIEYEIQDGINIEIKENYEIKNNLDKEIMDNSQLIIDNLEKMGIAKENIKFVNNQFENYKKTKNSGSIYTKTVGYSKNNLTTKPNYNFTAIYEISPKKSLFPYYKKGLIQINRNDLDFMRSITDYTMNYKDTNLKDYKINEEHVQEHTRNILNDIGGYKNIEFYDNIKTRQKMLELTICMWIYLKNKQDK